MPRMSIYVPDDMKAEIDAIGERVNWSNAAQAAFGVEIQRNKWPQEPKMEQVIDRLKTSKQTFQAQEIGRGKQEGRNWAMKIATYDLLRKISRIEVQKFFDEGGEEGELYLYVDRKTGTDPHSWQESFWFDPDSNTRPSDEYVIGYLEGAAEVWTEVADKL